MGYCLLVLEAMTDRYDVGDLVVIVASDKNDERMMAR